MQRIKDYPVEERPYEKCFNKGAEYLSDIELLAIVLRTGTNGLSSYDLAKNVLSINENQPDLLSLMHLTKEELLKINGIGMVKAVQILAIAELSKRIAASQAKQELKLDKAETIAHYFMEKLRHLEQECLYILFLDTKCKLIKEINLTKGTINQSLISSREILIEGLKCGAVNMILLHNHPSGDPTPSKSDINVTQKLYQAGKLIGINLLDHIIIGDKCFSSLNELKLLNERIWNE